MVGIVPVVVGRMEVVGLRDMVDWVVVRVVVVVVVVVVMMLTVDVSLPMTRRG